VAPPNIREICPSGHCTPKRDPINGESWLFIEGEDGGAKDAQRYYELAVRHRISFKGIFAMLVACLQTLRDELDAIAEEGERDAQLLGTLKLPIVELIQIWARSRDALLWLAQTHPERREKIEAQIAEQEAVMIAMLERYEQRPGAQ
jgi:hypothetical protein